MAPGPGHFLSPRLLTLSPTIPGSPLLLSTKILPEEIDSAIYFIHQQIDFSLQPKNQFNILYGLCSFSTFFFKINQNKIFTT